MLSENKISYQLKQVVDHLALEYCIVLQLCFQEGHLRCGNYPSGFHFMGQHSEALGRGGVRLAESRQAEQLMQIPSSISHLVASMCGEITSPRKKLKVSIAILKPKISDLQMHKGTKSASDVDT